MESFVRAVIIALAMHLAVCAGRHAHAFDRGIIIDGPVKAEVIRVIDGDTLLVAAKTWPQQTIEVYVRLRGIDAPEIKSECASTRAAGERARDALKEMAGAPAEIGLLHIAGDKYFGRVLADVTLSDGRDPAQALLSAGYVKPYAGGRKETESCS